MCLLIENSFEFTKSNSLVATDSGNGLVVNLLDYRLNQIDLNTKVPGSNPRLVLHLKQMDEAEILKKKVIDPKILYLKFFS